MDLKKLEPYLALALDEAPISGLPNRYRGKVRENYDLPDGRRILIATDRLSAFDLNIATIPLKGQVLTQTARYWFDATRDICPNHVLDYPDPNVVIAERLTILPVEMVVRDYMAGTTATSILTMYKAGKREMYGVTFPDGLRENEKLPQAIITPTTKALDGEHDAPLTPGMIVDRRLLTKAQWDKVSEYALALFARGRELAAKRGLILVDTKYEFGLAADGRIVLADEIHTPDSSRYWRAASYASRFESGQRPESFDKDFVRAWVVSQCDPYRDPLPKVPTDMILQTAAVYIEAYASITGESFLFPPTDQSPLERIKANLARYM